MIPMQGRLIICDIDGCISPEKSIPWDMARYQEFAQQVRRANAGEGPVAPLTLCTGRPQPYVEVMMKQLDIRHPAICENGAIIYTLHDNHARYGPGVTPEKIEGLRVVRTWAETDVLPGHPGGHSCNLARRPRCPYTAKIRIYCRSSTSGSKALSKRRAGLNCASTVHIIT